MTKWQLSFKNSKVMTDIDHDFSWSNRIRLLIYRDLTPMTSVEKFSKNGQKWSKIVKNGQNGHNGHNSQNGQKMVI